MQHWIPVFIYLGFWFALITLLFIHFHGVSVFANKRTKMVCKLLREDPRSWERGGSLDGMPDTQIQYDLGEVGQGHEYLLL